MQKSIKGALAAGVGGVLLLGGAGTLAYWTDTGTVSGSDITAGHLRLVSPSCAGWKMDGGAAFTTQLVVPGDVLTQVCTYEVDAAGEHITASFDVSTPTWDATNALTSQLALSATYKIGAATPSSFPAAVVDGDIITATVTATFTGGTATNASEDLAATLEDITITATQGHATP
ncbi:alternate-type signal peptide domain-containing protein [Nocardioides sp.]|uniref:alternate-type signal peptide domain-containing protein n=1 Tax=Nocardioides sp. TaxID=35761 RepID=UPI0031FE78C4|nr:hypothetical protein [Nocardioides sp.]